MTGHHPSRNFYLALTGIAVITVLMAIALTAMAPPGVLARDTQISEQLQKEPINLHGTVRDGNGTPVNGATVSLQDRAGLTTGNGSFSLAGITRKNSLLVIDAPGSRREFIPVHLFLPAGVSDVELDPVYVTAADPGEVRFLFGGDTHFGRRYIDPLETTPRNRLPPDNPNALIRVSDPGPGTQQVLRFIRPYFQEADFASVNLESPVTENVSTPHPEKDYVLMTLPGSLPALKWLGVDYVSLGNNHVYDYLEPGLRDTLGSLGSAGIPNSGAGPNATEAFRAYRVVLNGTPYSFLAMTSIDGAEHATSYVADDQKGGAANLKDSDRVLSAIEREIAAGYIPVVQVHGGDEYTFDSPDYIGGRMELVSNAGAGLVVSHHPHIAQGVGIMNGVVVIDGLGNLAFDAERHETMLGLLARVDMEGKTVKAVRLIPVYIGNFTPRPVSGRVADILLRRLGEFSRDSPYPVYPYNGQGWVALGENETVIGERTVEVNVTLPASGTMVLDLRQLARDDESLAGVSDDAAGSQAQAGRDLMIYGDFEDWDIDDTAGETNQWDLSGNSSQLTVDQPFRGTSSLLSVRTSTSTDDSVIPFRNRIRVMGDARNQVPNKNLSFIGYIRGEQAGPVRIIAKYLASEGEQTFGEEEILSLPGGTFPWEQFVADIHMPPDNPAKKRDPATDPRALQVFIRQSPAKTGTNIAEFDDLAIISWEDTVNLTQGAKLRTPHARDFLRISGTPGTHHLALTFQSYKPLFPGNST